MKIFSAAQIKACDAYTVHAGGITSLDLMERAAARCVDWITGHYPQDTLFVVLCGVGNNGGDGLAITRMLHALGFGVKAFQLQFDRELSPDCRANLLTLKNIDQALVEEVPADTFITDIPEHILIIDAIFGTGLNRPLEGWTANFIGHINELPNPIIAIDIPSGMPADFIANNEAAIMKADHTLSFQFYKRSFLHPETGRFAGTVHVLDIGLDWTFIEATHTHYQIIDLQVIRQFYRPRPPFSHKGTFGTAMIIGGSYGMIGAAALCARAASRGGAGKVIALVPECGYSIVQTLVPEALCSTNGDQYIRKIRDWASADAIGIGPGLGTKNETITAFEELLDACKKPLVIDADALNILGRRKDLLHKVPAGSILTPHPAEFERVFGATPDSMHRLEHARTQAMKYNLVIVLKDRYTAIVTPEGECWYNVTGNAGLATAGTGDVLTGLITALIAQSYEPIQAALLAVYLHGLAAGRALERQSFESMIAGDLSEYLGAAYKELSK